MLARLVWVALTREQPGRALVYGREVARLWRERSMKLSMTLDCVEAFAAALAANNATRQAVRLWSAIEAFRTRVANVGALVEQPRYDHYLALARRMLGDTTYEAEWQAGTAQTWEQATDAVLAWLEQTTAERETIS